MSIHYDLYDNPLPDGHRRKRLHARVITQGTTGTGDLAELIHQRCTLTPGDIKAALSELSDVMVRELSHGKRVHLEGLGYFQLTLETPPVREAKDIRAGRIHVKSIAFRPEQGLKERFLTLELTRVREKNHSKPHSDEQIKAALRQHFTQYPHLTSGQFRMLCGLTRSTAQRYLKRLLTEGTLLKTGHARSPLYIMKQPD